jgi:hypothetical protein
MSDQEVSTTHLQQHVSFVMLSSLISPGREKTKVDATHQVGTKPIAQLNHLEVMACHCSCMEY